MNDRTNNNPTQSDGRPPSDELDGLLRQWHEDNRTTAAASRDQLLARLRTEPLHTSTTPTHETADTRAHAALLVLALRRVIMHRYTRVAASLVFVVALIALLFPPVTQRTMADDAFVMLPDGGRLDAFNERGEHIGPCPLKHTNVDVQIAGHFSRTTVTQQYHNPYDSKIEAVYTFPLGHNGAVDRMTMTIGDRVIVGEVQEREQARRTYESARDQGYVASLLEQERPNIFTQSVANIEPGEAVTIEISYVEILESIDGKYTFVFPMVVAPRYIPGSPLGMAAARDGTFSPDTDQVEDASRITPMPTKPDVRAGHDISVQVRLETGGPALEHISSALHDVVTFSERRRDGQLTGVSIALKAETEIPNRDFVLSWKQSGDGIDEAIFTHTGDAEKYGDFAGGFFTMILQPPHRVEDADARPRELIFVLDNSGSMRSARLDEGGYSAIDAAKQVINQAIDTMRPNDRFNIISFNNSLDMLWEQPQANTEDNRKLAQQYVDRRQGGGGTEMANAVYAALGAHQWANIDRHRSISPRELADLPADGRHVRVRAALTQFLIDRGGSNYILRVAGDLLIPVQLQADLPTVLQPEGVTVEVTGQWVTQKGRRVFIVEQTEMVNPDDVDPMRIVLFVTDGLVGNDEAIIAAVREHAKHTRMFTIGMSHSPNRYLLDKMAEAGRGAADFVVPGDDIAAIVQRFADRIATPVLTDITLDFDGVEVVDIMPGLDRLPDLFDFSPLIIHGRYTTPGTGTLTVRGMTGAGPYTRTLDLELPAEQEAHDVTATLWARANIDRLMIDDDKDRIITLGQQFQIMSKYTSFVAVEMQRKTIDGKSQLVRVPIEFPKGMSWEGVFGEGEEPEVNVVDSRIGRQRSTAPARDSMRLLVVPDAAPSPQSPPPPPQSAPSPPAPPPPAQFMPPAPESDRQEITFSFQQPTDGSDPFGSGKGSGGAGGGGLFGETSSSMRGRELSQEEIANERLSSVKNLIRDTMYPDDWTDHGGHRLALQELDGRITAVALDGTAEAETMAKQVNAFISHYKLIFTGDPKATDVFGGIGFEDRETDITVLRVLYQRTIELGYTATSLENALADLRARLGGAMVVDWNSLNEWTNLHREQLVSIPTQSRTVLQTLTAVLGNESLGGDVMVHVRDGRITVESRETAARHTQMVVYDVGALIEKGVALMTDQLMASDELQSVILEMIDTNDWRDMGGSIGMMHAIDHWLFIKHIPDTHRKINRLLMQLQSALGIETAAQANAIAWDDAKVIRVYQVQDLLQHGVDRASQPHVQRDHALSTLVDLIYEVVDTPGWFDLGGQDGGLTSYADALIIRHDRTRHDDIARLLQQLRRTIDDSVKNTTESFGHGNRILAMYDVHDMIRQSTSPRMLDEMMDYITQRVDPDGWHIHGGNTSTILEFASVLLIHTTPANQQRVAEVIEDIRRLMHSNVPIRPIR